MDVGNLISGSSAFSKSSLNIWKFMVHILLKAILENFDHYMLACENECNCVVVWTFFGIDFLWDWNENWPFPDPWPLLTFSIYLPIDCSTVTALSFRIWNRSTGIPSPPLTLLVLILPKAHLITHTKMSGSRWVIRPLWLSGSWRSFCEVLLCILASSSNYLCFCKVHTISVLYCSHLCMKWFLGISSFLEEIPGLFHSVFSFLSLHWSLRKAFLSFLAFLWISALRCVYLSFSPLSLASLLLSATFKASIDNHWRRKWQPTPVFLPGESQGKQSLVGYHLWGCTESDTMEAMQQQLTTK